MLIQNAQTLTPIIYIYTYIHECMYVYTLYIYIHTYIYTLHTYIHILYK